MFDNGKNKMIELRSGSIDEILSRKPNWILRWGSTILLAVTILVLGLSSKIKYQERFTSGISMQIDTLTGNYRGKIKLPEYITIKEGSSVAAVLKMVDPLTGIVNEYHVPVSLKLIEHSENDMFVIYECTISPPVGVSSWSVVSAKNASEGKLSFEIEEMSLLERVVKPVK